MSDQVKIYKFSQDYFDHNIPRWKKHLAPFKDIAGVNYLEVGSFEGRSVIWMLENILTHSEARATCIDCNASYNLILAENLKISGFADKVKIIEGFSEDKLKEFPKYFFDIIYIDGNHNALNVLTDAVLSWPLLKNGGIMIFDDYQWGLSYLVEKRPKAAIDAFIVCFNSNLDVIDNAYQVIIRKKPVSKS